MLEKTLEQRLEQCLEKRMDGSCRSHPPYEKDLLIWTNRVYDPTTHQIKSRISPQYNLTLKQGLCAKGNGVNSYASATTPINTYPFSYAVKVVPTSLDINQCLISLSSSASSTVNFDLISAITTGSAYVLVRQGGTTYISNTNITGSSEFAVGVPTIAIMEFASKTEINLHINGNSFNIPLGVGVELPDPSVNRFGILASLDSTPSSFSNAKVMWACQFERALTTAEKTALMNDNPFGVTWASATDSFYAFEGNMRDLVSTRHMTNNGISLTERCNNSTFYCDEHGFAVKSGAIYPMKLDGSGYAGLVGEPDAVYHGLIATKGQPEIGTKQYLGTEYDFGDAEAITDAGISWDEWDGEDTNLDTVGTAETDLDTDYYNAITANLMTNTSIAGYAGTSNVKSRLFFKVANRVMKDDGSFLAESGRVQEILVYKRDLSASEILRVQKYCREVTE